MIWKNQITLTTNPSMASIPVSTTCNSSIKTPTAQSQIGKPSKWWARASTEIIGSKELAGKRKMLLEWKMFQKELRVSVSLATKEVDPFTITQKTTVKSPAGCMMLQSVLTLMVASLILTSVSKPSVPLSLSEAEAMDMMIE